MLFAAAGVLFASHLPSGAEPITLVDVNFDNATPGQSPLFLNGSPPASLPSDRLVGMNFGSATVVTNVPGMNQAIQLSHYWYSQPVVFQNSLTPTLGRTFRFEMDFFLSNFQKRAPDLARSVDEFAVLFDCSDLARMDFTTDGTTGQISVGYGTPTYVGTFSFDTTHHLELNLDLDHATWSASLDHVSVFENARFRWFPFSTWLSSVRINMNDDTYMPNTPDAFLNNIRLTALTSIPEPAAFQLLLAGGTALVLFKRRKANSARVAPE